MSRSDRNPSGKPPCTIPGCDRRVDARGLCKTHYMRWSKHGDGFDRSPINPAYSTPERSFEARTRRVGDCLVWTGFTNERGYGHIHVEGRRKRAHRYAWEKVHGPIPSGMVIDHTCFTPSCVEVGHLRLATKSENGSNRASARNAGLTGYRNVVRDGGRFRVVMRKNGETFSFGSYETPEEAAIAAEGHRKALFGDFAGARLTPPH